jgi:phosphocarrier protein FPr
MLSAETALELLAPDQADRVLLCEAPLVEGAVAAGVAARAGQALADVADEARRGLEPKAAHLGAGGLPEPPPVGAREDERPDAEGRVEVRNPHGLHARPLSRLVAAAAEWDAEVEVRNATTGAGPASARSPTGLALLGALSGHELVLSASGREAERAVEALVELAREGFGELEGETATGGTRSPSHTSTSRVTPTGGAPAAPVEPAAAAALPTAAGPAAAPTAAGSAVPAADAAGPAPSSAALPSAAPAPGAVLSGLPASPGVAVGPARLLRAAPRGVPRRPAGDPEAERRALDAARDHVREELDRRRRALEARAGPDEAAILAAGAGLLDDPALLDPAHAAIEGGTSAAAAWADAVEEVAAAYRTLADPYLRARAVDLEDVGARVVRRLLAEDEPGLEDLAGILVAEDLAPADAAALDPALVRGIVTSRGGPTSHGAILARALGVPAVAGAGPVALALEEGTELALDGEAGTVTVAPDAEHRARLEARGAQDALDREADRAAAHEPAITRDGTRVEIAANVGSPADASAAAEAGADGVGLLRSEFLFTQRSTLPDEYEQESAYRAVAERLRGRPVILRTLDVGADKPLAALPQPPEDNPFLGARGIRLSLEEPDTLRTQLRAALRVAADLPLRVMFPMVATVEELRAARSIAQEAREELERAGVRVPARPELGVMVEVPSAALCARVLAREVDFLSLGTNDLAQYVLAAERGNARVAGLVDGLHPAVLRLVAMTVEGAEEEGRWVGVCGELAADPLATPVLVGLGVRELSMAPPAIPRVKRAVREIELAAARELAAAALAAGSAAEVRRLVQVGCARARAPG